MTLAESRWAFATACGGDMVYVYTINYKTGKITERYGLLSNRVKWDDAHQFFEKGTAHYLTNVSGKEGEPRGASIWFRKPNPEAAKKAFSDRARKMKQLYLDKAINEEHRIMKEVVV